MSSTDQISNSATTQLISSQNISQSSGLSPPEMSSSDQTSVKSIHVISTHPTDRLPLSNLSDQTSTAASLLMESLSQPLSQTSSLSSEISSRDQTSGLSSVMSTHPIDIIPLNNITNTAYITSTENFAYNVNKVKMSRKCTFPFCDSNGNVDSKKQTHYK